MKPGITRDTAPARPTVPVPARPPANHSPLECARVKGVLARIGDKWAVLIIGMLGDRPMRFNEMRRSIGAISQRMLTLTLRGLERDGFVSRKVHPSVPPKVEYALTDMGRSVLGPVRALGEWAFAHQPQVEAARAEFDARGEH